MPKKAAAAVAAKSEGAEHPKLAGRNREYERRKRNAFNRTSFLLTELKRPSSNLSSSQCGRTERTVKLSIERRQPDEVARFFSIAMFERFDEATRLELLRFLPRCDVVDGRPTRDAFTNLAFRNSSDAFLEALKRGEYAHLQGLSFEDLLRRETEGPCVDTRNGARDKVGDDGSNSADVQSSDDGQTAKNGQSSSTDAACAASANSASTTARKRQKTTTVVRRRSKLAPSSSRSAPKKAEEKSAKTPNQPVQRSRRKSDVQKAPPAKIAKISNQEVTRKRNVKAKIRAKLAANAPSAPEPCVVAASPPTPTAVLPASVGSSPTNAVRVIRVQQTQTQPQPAGTDRVAPLRLHLSTANTKRNSVSLTQLPNCNTQSQPPASTSPLQPLSQSQSQPQMQTDALLRPSAPTYTWVTRQVPPPNGAQVRNSASVCRVRILRIELSPTVSCSDLPPTVGEPGASTDSVAVTVTAANAAPTVDAVEHFTTPSSTPQPTTEADLDTTMHSCSSGAVASPDCCGLATEASHADTLHLDLDLDLDRNSATAAVSAGQR